MALEKHSGTTIPLGLLWALTGWNKLPRGMEEDCIELINDPLVRLSKGAVEFPSLGLRIYLIWLPLVLVAGAALKICLYDVAKHDGDRFIAWAGALGIIAVYVIAPMFVLRRRLRLDLTGFHIVQGGRELTVPWTAILPARDYNVGLFQIRIPVTDRAKDLMFVTAESAPISLSDGATPFGLKFENEAEINLTWPFVLSPQLFIEVTKKLAVAIQSDQASSPLEDARLTASPVVDFDRQLDDPPAGIKLLPYQAIQLPVSAVTFPPVCCRCGAEPCDVRRIHARTRNYWWIPSQMGATLQMPVCKSCWNSSWLRSLAVIVVLELIWTLLTTYVVFGSLEQSWTAYAIVALIAVIPTRVMLFWLPPLWWRVADVVLNFSTNEFRLRFAHPGYRQLVLNQICLVDNTGASYDVSEGTQTIPERDD